MEDILDSEKEIPKKSFFTFVAFISGIISFILFLITMYSVSYNDLVETMSRNAQKSFAICMLASVIVGVVSCIASIVLKEKNTWMKWCAVAINLLLFILVVGSTLYAIYIDNNLQAR